MKFLRKSIIFYLLLCATFIFPAVVYAGSDEAEGAPWTLDQGTTWYEKDTTVYTGATSTRVPLKTGQHYYGDKDNPSPYFPVSKWIVKYPDHTCIHGNETDGEWWNIDYRPHTICGKALCSGWVPVCADCGEEIWHFVYASKEAVQNVTKIKNGDWYYYVCQFCKGMETLGEFVHDCKNLVSYNQYTVIYNGNGATKGRSTTSTFMYNNADKYDGDPITADTKLRKNAFQRLGYTFVGWALEKTNDISKVVFTDEEEIYNYVGLSNGNRLVTNVDNVEDNKKITLYAVWKKTRNTLEINPNGGTYLGSANPSRSTQSWGSTYTISLDKLVSPAGPVVSFGTNGGNTISSITTTTSFKTWNKSAGFNGDFNGITYTFRGPDATVETLTAIYTNDAIILPYPTKEGYNFGGWYKDEELEQFVGNEGDEFTPSGDTTLHAKWVSLRLNSVDNYEVYNGTGAVDLDWYWSQDDGHAKVYKAYQSTDKANWRLINTTSADKDASSITERFDFSGEEQTYTIPSSGFYVISAYGAKGADYENNIGGNGGKTEIKLWLYRGETITMEIGGSDGYHGGGSGTADEGANGGGYTSVLLNSSRADRDGKIIIIAAGGGGATELSNGLGGGELLTDPNALGISDVYGDMPDGGTQGVSGSGGGGGGYFGGLAGEVDKHFHTDACYKVTNVVKTCNPTTRLLQTNYTWNCYSCRQPSNNVHVTEYRHNGCSNTEVVLWYYSYGCIHCGKPSSGGSYIVSHTYNSTGKVLNCPYEDGEIITATSAYGGSSYINQDFTIQQSYDAACNDDNGFVSIASGQIYFMEDQILKEVKAPDCASPDKIDIDTIKLSPVGDNLVATWTEPKDNGTLYYHKVESYQLSTMTDNPVLGAVSNITENTLTSGVYRYYYALNTNKNYTVTLSDDYVTDCRVVFTKPDENITYLHVMTVDRAGNTSETAHYKIEKEKLQVNWPLYTIQADLTDKGNNVYAVSEQPYTYYVKADGQTPFTASFVGSMDGDAIEDYQINNVIYEIKTSTETQMFDIYVPNHKPVVSDRVAYNKTQLAIDISAPFMVTDALLTDVARTDSLKTVEWKQKFAAAKEYSGTTVIFIPRVKATNQLTLEESESDKTADEANAFTLIFDGEGPVIHGTEILEEIKNRYDENENVDIDKDAEDIIMNITAEDSLSGLKELKVVIKNKDNYIERTYSGTECQSIKITDDNLLFIGDVSIEIIAMDNVGNTTSLAYNVREFTMDTKVERILSIGLSGADVPTAEVNGVIVPKFKAGESGILTITTSGYVDKVVVIFPKELLQDRDNEAQNKEIKYIYNQAFYEEQEQQGNNLISQGVVESKLEFMIPYEYKQGGKTFTYNPDNEELQFKITAYKDGQKVQCIVRYEDFVVNGNIKNDIKTVILYQN